MLRWFDATSRVLLTCGCYVDAEIKMIREFGKEPRLCRKRDGADLFLLESVLLIEGRLRTDAGRVDGGEAQPTSQP